MWTGLRGLIITWQRLGFCCLLSSVEGLIFDLLSSLFSLLVILWKYFLRWLWPGFFLYLFVFVVNERPIVSFFVFLCLSMGRQ